MSNKSSTFAAEIGNGQVWTLLRRKQNGQRRGATREGYSGVKHIPAAAGRRSARPFRFRVLRFFVTFDNLTPDRSHP